MADTTSTFNVGSTGNLVSGNLTIDFTNPAATGNLTLLSGGLPLGVTITGVTVDPTTQLATVTGAAVNAAGVTTNVTLSVPGPTAASTTVNTSVNGVASASATENLAVVCFASGTLIQTIHGDVAVEDLAIGDLVITASGAERPIVWIGHRTVNCAMSERPRNVLPIRIAAHAFGENKPYQDLLVSPGHSLCATIVSEVLVTASALLNGSSIQQIDVDEVTYWHVELDSHDILLANGLPAESYCPVGNREFFVEAATVRLDNKPDPLGSDPSLFCRPLVDHGPLLEAISIQLAARAAEMGWTQEGSSLDTLRLIVDGRIVEPVFDGSTAAFLVPADASDAWIVSGSGVPARLGINDDLRTLGVMIAAMSLDDGLKRTDVAMDDERLAQGFYWVEDNGARWTDGRAHLPAALWSGCRGAFFLRLETVGTIGTWKRQVSDEACVPNMCSVVPFRRAA